MRAGLTVEELLTERQVLELRLAEAIRKELHAFHALTGVRIAGVDVGMVHVEILGQVRPTYSLAGVRVQLDALETR